MADNAAVLTREFVPQEFHDRPYLKDLLDKPWDKERGAEVFKKLDGAETLIGKRPAIPDPKTAKPEDLDKFFEQFRPEKAEDYEIKLDENDKADEGFLKAVRTAFHAGKINKVQAQGFLKTMDEYGRGQRAEAAKKQAASDAAFDVLAKTMLGQENKPTMERVKKLIAANAPAVAKAAVAKLDDNNLLIMAAVIDSIYKKYASEDDLKTKDGGGGSGQSSVAEKREKAMALQAEIAKMKPMDPGLDKKQAEVNALFKEIAEASA